MFQLVILISLPYLLLAETDSDFPLYFGSATLSQALVPPPARQKCNIERVWELTTSFIPDQERARAAYDVMHKALPHMPIEMNDLWVIGALESLKKRVVENFRETWTGSRIYFLYDKVKWEKNEVPFWIHTSGDVAAVLTGQILYAHYSTKNRDINGYYVAESPHTPTKSEEQKLFEKSPHFQNAYKFVNTRLRFYFNQTKDFTVEEVLAAYDLCRHLHVTLHLTRDHVLWCKLFYVSDLDIFEFHEELNLGHNRSVFAPNVCGIVESMDSTLNTKNGLIGVSFFTITQQFLPFLDALNLLPEIKAKDFEYRTTIRNRVKETMGRLSSLTIYRYGPGCSKNFDMFLNSKALKDSTFEGLFARLQQVYKCDIS